MKELAKNYDPKKYENQLYAAWETGGFFEPGESRTGENFSVVLPPPNVTGVLHMGHAVMLAIQDMLVRYHRMRGDRTLWLPGTDHAAIATQTKVEKNLLAAGMTDPRAELGREKFLAEVEKFARASHDTIINQAKKMGCSLDWSREAYTLDEVRNLAVKKVFKMMYDDGLIERGYRIVNWCPRCHSTLADDEVEYREQKAKIYTFKYSPDFPLTIATTRPETKLGDTAVAVNPKDKRYKKYIGKEFIVPGFAGGADLKIKIIADEAVDPEFGTGALGVTPAHSHVDYEMALKNKLPVIKVIDEDGRMTAEAGAAYAGMDVLTARAKVVENLRAAGLLEKEEEADNNLSVCYRCASAMEPLPSEQWFVRVEKSFKVKGDKLAGFKSGQEVTLKDLMIGAVKSKQIEIIPERFEKTYFHWIENLRDWCISRQIWFGHRLPVYYCDACGEVTVEIDAPISCNKCGGAMRQDPDTLDTWFSSGLWTFSTLAHKSEDIRLENGRLTIDTEDFRNFHPTSVMETGYDILFFWVARMILMTTYALGDIPFKQVYLHGLVRDEQGRKMSKSLGNVLDPLEMIDKYGTDATRLSLLLGTGAGNDMKLSEEKVAGFKNFTNKLWNICRFMLLNIEEPKKEIDVKNLPLKTLADNDIFLELENIKSLVADGLDNFKFSSAGEVLRDFTWGKLADQYLEITKIEGGKSEILNYILNTLLKLWHPFMPFVTEAIWQEVYEDKGDYLMIEKWPETGINGELLEKDGKMFGYLRSSIKPIAVAERERVIRASMNLLMGIVEEIRRHRAERGIEPSKKIKALIVAKDNKELIEGNQELIKKLWTNVEELTVVSEISEKPRDAVFFTVSDVEVYLDFSGAVDKEAEGEKLAKEIADKEKYAGALEAKLANKEFTANAPESVVAKEQEKLDTARAALEKLREQLKNLK